MIYSHEEGGDLMKRSRREGVIALLIFATLWTGLLINTGSLKTGFNFMEDHEIIDMQKKFNNASFMQVFCAELKNELRFRFLPLFYAFRYAFAYLFGLHFFYWNLIFLLLLLLASFLFYKAMRLTGMSFYSSLSVPLLMMAGSQAEAIVRLATSELMGMLFVSSALFFILKSSRMESSNRWHDALAHVSVFLACCSKEAFIVLVPVFISAKIYFDSIYRKISLKEAIFRNRLFVIIDTLIILFCALMIFGFINQENESQYAGFDFDFPKIAQIAFAHFFNRANLNSLLAGNGIYFIFILTGILILFFFTQKSQEARYAPPVFNRKRISCSADFKTFVAFWMGVCVYVSITQYLLHYKIGFTGHYLLPFTFGVATLLGVIAQAISNLKRPVLRWAVNLSVACLLIFKTAQARETMDTYSQGGKAMTELINQVSDNCSQSCKILLSGDELLNIEHFTAIIKYLEYFNPDAKFLIQPLAGDEKRFMQIAEIYDPSVILVFRDSFFKIHNDKVVDENSNLREFDMIIVMGYCRERFLEKNRVDFKPESYRESVIGREWNQYTLYQKEGSVSVW